MLVYHLPTKVTIMSPLVTNPRNFACWHSFLANKFNKLFSSQSFLIYIMSTLNLTKSNQKAAHLRLKPKQIWNFPFNTQSIQRKPPLFVGPAHPLGWQHWNGQLPPEWEQDPTLCCTSKQCLQLVWLVCSLFFIEEARAFEYFSTFSRDSYIT